MAKKIFVTGGAGYIGSHTCIELLRQEHEIMVFDNLSNSSDESLRRVELLTNRKVKLVIGDIRDEVALRDAMHTFKPTSVIHFAGLKAVGDSVKNPLLYYKVNVAGSINVLRAMASIDCSEIVFSSSATVYGEKTLPPYSETQPTDPISPYGRSKLMVENILTDWVNAQITNRAVILRYFNPVGAHSSGLLGEDPTGVPNNLMPLIAQVAQRKRLKLAIYGSNYETKDGTGERDYVHVSDLAEGHVKAVEKIHNLKRIQILNLGTGRTTSVKELVETFEKINGVSVPTFKTEPRRGDVAKSYADPTLANKLLGFSCKRSVEEMCIDTWNWIKKNPDGYA